MKQEHTLLSCCLVYCKWQNICCYFVCYILAYSYHEYSHAFILYIHIAMYKWKQMLSRIRNKTQFMQTFKNVMSFSILEIKRKQYLNIFSRIFKPISDKRVHLYPVTIPNFPRRSIGGRMVKFCPKVSCRPTYLI